MSGSGVKVTKDKVADLMRSVRKLTDRELLVGVPDTNVAREPEPGEPNPASNAVIAYVQELGDEELNIPPRPFLVPGIESIKSEIVQKMRKAGELALEGNLKEIDKMFVDVGLTAASAVQDKISNGPFTPLSPVTLAKRLAKGRTGDKPLLDSGQLRRAITYVVRPKAKKGDD